MNSILLKHFQLKRIVWKGGKFFLRNKISSCYTLPHLHQIAQFHNSFQKKDFIPSNTQNKSFSKSSNSKIEGSLYHQINVNNFDVIHEYKQISQTFLNNQDEASKLTNFQNYLNASAKTFFKIKDLSAQEKGNIQKDLAQMIEKDIQTIMKFVDDMLKNINGKNDFESVFKFLYLCFTQNIHTKGLYTCVKKLSSYPELIFKKDQTRIFSLVLFYAINYEPNVLSENCYKELLNYFEINFNNIMRNTGPDEIASLLEAAVTQDIVNESLKEIMIQDVLQRIKKGMLDDAQIIKIFHFFCKGDFLKKDSPELLKFEKTICEGNLKYLEKTALSKLLFNLRVVQLTSEPVFQKVLNILKRNPELLDEKTLSPVLNYLSTVQYPESFLKFLVDYVMKNYSKKNFSVSILSSFIFQLSRSKTLMKSHFKVLEKYILENAFNFRWKPVDLRCLFSGCRIRGFLDSSLYQKLEIEFHKSLKNKSTDPDDLTNLIYEYSHALHLPSFSVFETILNISNKNASLLFNSIENALKVVRSILHFLIKYKVANEQLYLNSYQMIEKELNELFPKLLKKLGETPLDNLELGWKVRFFQIIFTMNLEFPELIKKFYPGLEVIKYFETQQPDLSPITSDFTYSVASNLSNMNIKNEIEHRVYTYYIDIFIEPNIAIQTEGKAHYTGESLAERTKDIFRDYHLKKLGFKIVKIPIYEYENISSIEKQQAYLKDIIFSENLEFRVPELK